MRRQPWAAGRRRWASWLILGVGEAVAIASVCLRAWRLYTRWRAPRRCGEGALTVAGSARKRRPRPSRWLEKPPSGISTGASVTGGDCPGCAVEATPERRPAWGGARARQRAGCRGLLVTATAAPSGRSGYCGRAGESDAVQAAVFWRRGPRTDQQTAVLRLLRGWVVTRAAGRLPRCGCVDTAIGAAPISTRPVPAGLSQGAVRGFLRRTAASLSAAPARPHAG